MAVIFTTQAAHAVAQPACTEYCYEPIPKAGNNDGPSKNSPGTTGNGSGTTSDGTGATGTASNSPGDAPVAGDEGATGSPLAKKLGVTERAAKKKRGKADQEKSKKRGGKADKEDDSEVSAGALSDVKPPPAGDSKTGDSSLGLFIALLALTAITGGAVYMRRRREGRPVLGALLRLGAIGLVMLGLFWAGTGNALANTRAAAPKGFFGMMSQESISDEDAARMAAGGVESVRIPFAWHAIQASAGEEFDWRYTDQQVARVARSGMRILPALFGTPPGYAARSTVIPVRNGHQIRGWVNFVRSAAQRYGPNGTFWMENPDVPANMPPRTWQIWNEPNFHFFATPVAPRQYLTLLKRSYRVLKSIDGRAQIMVAGLYGSPRETPRKAMKSFNFINQLYRMKGKRFIDSIALHPYAPNTTQLRRLLDQVMKTLRRWKAHRTPIHITELGWGSDRRTVFGKRTPAGQARQLTQGYRFLLRNRNRYNLRSVYWYAWRDVPTSQAACNFCYSTGLFTAGQDSKPKPAWNRFIKLSGGTW